MTAIGICILGSGCMGEAPTLEVNQIVAAALASSETDRMWQRSEHLKGYST